MVIDGSKRSISKIYKGIFIKIMTLDINIDFTCLAFWNTLHNLFVSKYKFGRLITNSLHANLFKWYMRIWVLHIYRGHSSFSLLNRQHTSFKCSLFKFRVQLFTCIWPEINCLFLYFMIIYIEKLNIISLSLSYNSLILFK